MVDREDITCSVGAEIPYGKVCQKCLDAFFTSICGGGVDRFWGRTRTTCGRRREDHMWTSKLEHASVTGEVVAMVGLGLLGGIITQ